MCEITFIRTKRRVGYKVLAHKNNKFYSTFTGQKLKLGNVPKPPIRAKRISNKWNSNLDNRKFRSCSFYNIIFAGKTSAFIKKADAKNLFEEIFTTVWSNDYLIVLVKITFGNNVFLGSYSDLPVIASDTIRSIEIIK